MADLRLEFETDKPSMAELRPALDAALEEHLPGDLLESRWEGDVLHVFGLGARGTVRLEAGRLVGEARLSPPASLLRPVIEQKLSHVLRKVAC